MIAYVLEPIARTTAPPRPTPPVLEEDPGRPDVTGTPKGIGASGVNITRAARELMTAHGIGVREVAELGKVVVKREDVLRLLREQADPPPRIASNPAE